MTVWSRRRRGARGQVRVAGKLGRLVSLITPVRDVRESAPGGLSVNVFGGAVEEGRDVTDQGHGEDKRRATLVRYQGTAWGMWG